MERIGLKQAIEALRVELSDAIASSANEQLRFQVGPINLEFQVEIEHSAEASGGMKFWVVQLGGKGSRTSTTAHTVSMSLTPVSQDSREPVLTGSAMVPE